VLERFWRAVRFFAGHPLRYARSADELAERRALDHMYAVRHAMGDVPRGVRAFPSHLVYTELNRRGVTVWRAA
jgi:hypothetical protein